MTKAQAQRAPGSIGPSGEGNSSLRESSFENLVKSRIASVKRINAAYEIAARSRREHVVAKSPSIQPPTGDEATTLNFVAWVRSRDKNFFANAPPTREGIQTEKRFAYEQQLLAFSRAWKRGPLKEAGEAIQQERFSPCL